MVLIRKKVKMFLTKLSQKRDIGRFGALDIMFYGISALCRWFRYYFPWHFGVFWQSGGAFIYATIRRHHYCVVRDCEQFISDIQTATLHGNGTMPHGTFAHNPKACCTNTPMSFGDRRSGCYQRWLSLNLT